VVGDEFCRTSVPEVFAAGDVANHLNPRLGRRLRVEHWQNAQHQGAAAARNMLGAGLPFAEVPWVWSDQYDVKLEIAGLPSPDDDVVIDGDPATLEFVAYLLRGGELGAVIGLNRSEAVRGAREAIARGTTPDVPTARSRVSVTSRAGTWERSAT
jgi:3-phenylpropionate/trans-cinnamate dioxygenase ferredoxin reductase component